MVFQNLFVLIRILPIQFKQFCFLGCDCFMLFREIILIGNGRNVNITEKQRKEYYDLEFSEMLFQFRKKHDTPPQIVI